MISYGPQRKKREEEEEEIPAFISIGREGGRRPKRVGGAGTQREEEESSSCGLLGGRGLGWGEREAGGFQDFFLLPLLVRRRRRCCLCCCSVETHDTCAGFFSPFSSREKTLETIYIFPPSNLDVVLAKKKVQIATRVWCPTCWIDGWVAMLCKCHLRWKVR